MAQESQIEAIAQQVDNYEIAAGRELRQRVAARVRALRNRDAVTDGGTVADSGETTVEPVYTRHIEPPAQDRKAYVRCRHCERELLVELGGRDRLPHALGCSQRTGEDG